MNMYYLNQAVDSLLNARVPPPKLAPPTRNRVDADPILVVYHETGKGPKPTPRNTSFLPLRTRLVANPFSAIAKAQSEAYYEEIDSIPAASLDLKSEFSAGHCNKVLQDLAEWIEVKSPNEIFTRKAKQVLAFRNARDESLEEVKKELQRRERRGEVGVEEGYLGDYDMVDTDEDEDSGQSGGIKNEVRKEGKVHDKMSRHTEAALDEAAEAGRKAAEEAKMMEGWQVEH
ncbi:hypothetical protein HBH56_116830 [Parastagonospora nodorum]|uniref:Uncharacterized protein n=1 Tax=Phaeosphaeria nodorum (strain SN15 / ATCC MYA-4574 / FGSC 10173) TaxID=321614 RepID=A0A7U2FH37_PHANO|nr:hypothetical protein HBH56_116830 [Parastagonospora nodorum]KAH4136647.1 hypothetical protein HBH45_132590 [Parastagonospora nodorum]KAH4563923.1 hypothetical protein HBH84_166630 [Parastagonospora nodorum]KAH5368433.1 hypothetical protein HBI49_089180 [Parastagonospora nodorum]QRD05153.1 hypothetical protein JI435_444130 [Parastagonospora nodorum SN15]